MLRGAVAGLAALCAVPAMAAPGAYDIAFVDAFADACVPGRLSYETTQKAAEAAGWQAVSRSANAELDRMMAISETAAQDPELKAAFDYRLYARAIEGLEHYLVVSRVSAVIDPEEQPENPMVLVGCYLYNLDATQPIDPEPVTALLRQELANSHADETLTAYVWGPPCPMPRTGDTYLTFLPDQSPQADAAGFSGLVLKFSTSEPDPGEVVPATYC